MVHITFRNLASTEAIKEAVEKKAKRLLADIEYPVELFVRLGKEKTKFYAEFTCRAEHRELIAHVETKDLYEAIDGAGRRVMQQLRRERKMRHGHGTARKAPKASAVRSATDVPGDIPHQEKRAR